MEKWLSVEKFAKLKGLSRQTIYMNIRLGKIKRWKKDIKEIMIFKISDKEL